MREKQKVLICGDVEGKFNTLFTRVVNINKKSGPFDMLLCVGNFFGVNNVEFEDYKNCEKSICIPTYVLGPNKEEHLHLYSDGLSEFCPNLYYLGKRGIFNSSGGLKIAYISGVPNEEAEEVKEYEFNKQSVIALRDTCLRGQPNFRGIDILITSPWPRNVFNKDKKVNENISGSALISWLATQLKPRYHISGLEGIYYERSPYRNLGTHGELKGEVATRFIGMARVGNPKKEKWIYALNLTPIDRLKLADLYQLTTDETECPYDMDLLSIIPEKTKNIQYFYNMDPPNEVKRKHSKGGWSPRKKAKPDLDQSKCWFCLASPNVEKHLVISVGSEVYLALSKGGLVEDHLLISPVMHYQSLLHLPDSSVREINKLKEALVKFFNEDGKVPIFFERNFKSFHLQIQVVPVPKEVLKELSEIFKDMAEMNNFTLNVLESCNRLEQVTPKGSCYFWVELPDVTLYTACKPNFPIQFARQVLSSGLILNVPDKVEWTNCTLTRDEENQLVQRIRKNFEPYDITL